MGAVVNGFQPVKASLDASQPQSYAWAVQETARTSLDDNYRIEAPVDINEPQEEACITCLHKREDIPGTCSRPSIQLPHLVPNSTDLSLTPPIFLQLTRERAARS